MITHTINGVVRPRVGIARHAGSDTQLFEAIALRRCALYRKTFRGTAISYPAEALRLDAVARWISERGITVDVTPADDLCRLRSAGVDASRIVMHCRGELSVSSARAGFGRFVVDSGDQIATLADNPLARAQRVVVDSTRSDELAAEVAAEPLLQLVGLHSRIGSSGESGLTEIVMAMIATMARISHRHAVVLSCVSLGDVAVAGGDGDPLALRRLAGIIDQAVEDGCIRYRYPRPALTVSPHRSVLLPKPAR